MTCFISRFRLTCSPFLVGGVAGGLSPSAGLWSKVLKESNGDLFGVRLRGPRAFGSSSVKSSTLPGQWPRKEDDVPLPRGGCPLP